MGRTKTWEFIREVILPDRRGRDNLEEDPGKATVSERLNQPTLPVR
ncbi:MAG TPA: hypothetical protein VH186_23320 [Chloroflexia bacterium]|nr:hypothetical protein [Chloroflexia bacterium]